MKNYIRGLVLYELLCIVYLRPFGRRNQRDLTNLQDDEVINYLHKYGYVEDMDNINEEKLKAGLQNFQYFIGVMPTGELNEKTTEMMQRPRCGRPDNMKGRRMKRYAVPGKDIWEKWKLVYHIDSYTNHLTQAVVDAEFKRALNVWSKIINVHFKPSTSPSQFADINVQFSPVDGESDILGYAYYPTNGTMVLDNDELWTRDSATGVNLFQVVVHESGHSLGLGHSDNENAVMYPMYMGYKSNFTLDMDDIKGIKALYNVIPCPIPSQFGDNNILCKNPKIDAIFDAPDNYMYVLKGDQFWKFTLEFVIVEGPKLISERWPEVPSNVDSAFTYWNNITYFFKNKYMWKYIQNKKSGKSKLISIGFSGIPDNIDASLIWSGNGKIYFFKGKNYWMFDPYKPASMRVNNTYPLPISQWNGLPNNLDAAVAIGGFSYFFKEQFYFKYDDRNLQVEDGYPRNIAKDLFGCI